MYMRKTKHDSHIGLHFALKKKQLIHSIIHLVSVVSVNKRSNGSRIRSMLKAVGSYS